jgi:hypothetical protein
LTATLALPLANTQAADQASTQAQRPKAQQRIYGSQLMTQQERDEYRAKMRAAKSQEERDRLRTEHHVAMQARAKERGVTLPDQPPGKRGGGGGPGPGPR